MIKVKIPKVCLRLESRALTSIPLRIPRSTDQTDNYLLFIDIAQYDTNLTIILHKYVNSCYIYLGNVNISSNIYQLNPHHLNAKLLIIYAMHAFSIFGTAAFKPLIINRTHETDYCQAQICSIIILFILPHHHDTILSYIKPSRK